ncbi:hypothetical protein ACM24_06160 [Helicobacter pylori]|uniref:hypothetical protein n=1 Tax=Helicobacter pylori TaxID=210 RepID=UPI000681DD04|nr:hypothetical protein [Helicobacter pylori]KNE05186.1 hypothetical protein ACM24_06160 [Helicobacter pylori]
MSKISSYQKLKAQNIALKAELNAKDQIIESKNETLKAKDQTIDETLKAKDQTIDETLKAKDQTIKSQKETIESQKETIGALKRETDIKDQLINFSTEERHRDEEKEHSRSCLGLE